MWKIFQLQEKFQCNILSTPGTDPGFCVRGTKVGEEARNKVKYDKIHINQNVLCNIWKQTLKSGHLPLIYTHCLETIWNFLEKIHAWVQGSALVGDPGGRSLPLKLMGFEYLGSFSVNNFEAFCECDKVY
jgi:hypothetical protein